MRVASRSDPDRRRHSRPRAFRQGGDDAGVPVRHGYRGGTLTFHGRQYPFTLTGELNGLGAISGIQGAGDVYNLRDVSQFAGAYIQGAGPLALGSAPGEIWLKNANGVIIRLAGQQNGITVSSGRYEIFVQLGG